MCKSSGITVLCQFQSIKRFFFNRIDIIAGSNEGTCMDTM